MVLHDKLSFLILLPGFVFSQNSECPVKKSVGGTCFTLKEKKDTSEFNCTSNCVYADEYGGDDLFCFKPGPYKREDVCPTYSNPVEDSVPGEECNRDCTSDGTNKTCVFTFVLEQLFSDTPGRLADGLNRSVLVYNGQLPGPTIAVCEGDNVVLKLENRLKGDDKFLLGAPFKESCQGPNCYLQSKVPANSTTLHFHGIREKQPDGSGAWSVGGPWSDGVPLVAQCPVPAGNDFTYTFLGSGGITAPYNNAPAGTYWYHSHVGRQRMNGAEGKLIIMPRTASNRFDVDLPENSLFLEEWYPNTTDATPQSLLVNGKGKQSPHSYSLKGEDSLGKYKEGGPVEYDKLENPSYNAAKQPNYEVFNITDPGKRYRFRIIGGIGDNVPIRVSVENHKFSAIATDSTDIETVHDLDALWVTAGERYDIVITTTMEAGPYKINVIHLNTSQPGAHITICSLAWLKYPDQTVDNDFVANCTEMEKEFEKIKNKKILNPVPTNFSNWGTPQKEGETEYIYPINLTSIYQATNIEATLNTQYVSMHGMKFNNYSMSFPKNYSAVPFLFQSPSNNTERCGAVCDADNECRYQQPSRCGGKIPPQEECDCQHVIQQPWLPSGYWFEIILINVKPRNGNREDGWGVAHPIHQHGGWFNIVGMGQFDHPIFREDIKKMDTACTAGKGCLPRNFNWPVFKDVIQVPTNGYVILRTPMDNRGVWIVHCHINWHIEHGMAMVFQIGEPDGPFRWAMGPTNMAAGDNKNKNCFTG